MGSYTIILNALTEEEEHCFYLFDFFGGERGERSQPWPVGAGEEGEEYQRRP